ncbi:MAG: hypothetical protein LBI53_03660 [Candidatus Peribacteria bacterium]|nr:hypothetical protein [Candidatus Peribacteria bacterium]
MRDSVGRIASTGYTINNIIDSTIKLTAIITATNQTVQVNKYFANVHTINR